MIFITESGSTYEVDNYNNRIRKLEGKRECTPRTGFYGQWKHFSSIHNVKVGDFALILWHDDVQPAPIDGATPGTITSKIVNIYNDDGNN